MPNCAYCDLSSKATREHVIPNWYNQTPGKSETFSARAPLTHLEGDILVRDVCQRCNNEILGSLDSYGKELYDQYFASPVYSGESVKFQCDGNQLIRWLLKLSYNSARAQNADSIALRDYRKLMLGQQPMTDRIRCWVHLITPTVIEATGDYHAAKRHESGSATFLEPLWFRIGQFRLRDYRADKLVQRMVAINSYCFTLLAARSTAEWPSSDFEEWSTVFVQSYPDAQAVEAAPNVLTISTGSDQVVTSLGPFMSQYPTRYSQAPTPEFTSVINGLVSVSILEVTSDMIAASNTADVVLMFYYMIATRENAMGFRQKVTLAVSGYDDDPRELCQIPEVQAYFRAIFKECPFALLFSHRDGALLKVLAACWVYEHGQSDESIATRMAEFANLSFEALNDVCHRLMISEEVNREVCFAAVETLTGSPYQP